ncbi:MAG: hypothetical protein R3325_14550 [Thermoanaerobaculia bacterium]|nr:hypothetical protein [Thermoanaerobaculia bacterium]
MASRKPGPCPGDAAPALALPTEAGTEFDLVSLAQRPVLVSFLSHAA